MENTGQELIEIYDNKDSFLQAYRKAKTWADLDKVYQALSIDSQKDLINALEMVKSYTGLDMRQDFLLNCMKSYVRYNS